MFPFSDYNYVPDYSTHKNKVSIDGREYNATFVKDHTKAYAVVLDIVDANFHDTYANISNWKITFYILWKKGKREQWECICKYKDYLKYETYGGFDTSEGLHHLLFQMETKKEQNRIKREYRIEELRETIKDSQKELKKLVGKK